jgi:hypothetical protein
MRLNCDTVECSGRKLGWNIQSCVGYRVSFGTRVVILCKSCVVERVQDAGGVFNMGGKQNGGEGRKKGYIYLSSCDILVKLVLLVTEHKTAQPSWCRTTRHLINMSCICKGQTPGALHVEQTAIYECKRLGDRKLCNVMCCESIS